MVRRSRGRGLYNYFASGRQVAPPSPIITVGTSRKIGGVWGTTRIHATQGSSTLNPQLHGTLDSNMRPWFKNVSAYSTSTCLSHSNMHISHSEMPKSPVRTEIFIPEAQNLFVERFLRDLFNTPSHGSVCGGGGTKSVPPQKSENT